MSYNRIMTCSFDTKPVSVDLAVMALYVKECHFSKNHTWSLNVKTSREEE